MRDTTIARNYAEALLALSTKANDTEGWGRMIADVGEAMRREPNLRVFLESPKVSDAKKQELLATALQDRMPRLMVRYLQILVTKGRQMLLPQIADEYRTLLDEASGRVRANVTVAREPSDAERESIAKALTKAVGSEVIPSVTVNPAILGGVVVRIGDTVMDGSVRRRLALLRSRMLSAR